MSKQYTIQIPQDTDTNLSSQAELAEKQIVFSRNRFVIKNWNTEPDGSGTSYTSTINAHVNTTLYAQWVRNDLQMKTVAGNTHAFDSDSTGSTVQYLDSTSGATVQSPFASVTELQFKTNLKEVEDKIGYVTSIGSNAFYYCSSLASANFPACQTIGSYAFATCTSLQLASFPACQTIGSYAFSHCSNLASANFPACQTIGSFAFRSCASLQSASFPACQTIGSYAFATCTSLQLASFPACQTIGSYAFSHCSNLASANFPACQTIGSFAFRYCSSLQSASFPACQMIDEGAFRYCSSLASASFPACHTISDCAFATCASLQSVSFPACQTIGSLAFHTCTSLKSLYLMSTSRVNLASTDAFNDSPLSQGGSGTIYVPSSLVTAYTEQVSTNHWSTLAARISGI